MFYMQTGQLPTGSKIAHIPDKHGSHLLSIQLRDFSKTTEPTLCVCHLPGQCCLTSNTSIVAPV